MAKHSWNVNVEHVELSFRAVFMREHLIEMRAFRANGRLITYSKGDEENLLHYPVIAPLINIHTYSLRYRELISFEKFFGIGYDVVTPSLFHKETYHDTLEVNSFQALWWNMRAIIRKSSVNHMQMANPQLFVDAVSNHMLLSAFYDPYQTGQGRLSHHALSVPFMLFLPHPTYGESEEMLFSRYLVLPRDIIDKNPSPHPEDGVPLNIAS